MVDLKSWLEELGMGQYAQSFAANDIDFDVLPDLTEAELERLGVSLGHRKRLRRAITALTSTASRIPRRQRRPRSSKPNAGRSR